MKFRTEINIPRSPLTLDPQRPILLAGSCFSDNIGRRMRLSLWKAFNPFGVLYNPLSIERALRCMILDSDDTVFEQSLFATNDVTRSWLFDSKISSEFRNDTLKGYRDRKKVALEVLKSAQALFVTFGTSYVYALAENTGYVVGNCHKVSADAFLRSRLSVSEIVTVWERLVDDLRDRYPGLEIIFTVSPVRHVKDGLEGNQRSKAVLLLAVEELCRRFPCCHYFPAYEIVNDDLRDYRFYASDLMHPSEDAVEYIWEKLKETYLDPEGEKMLKEGCAIVKGWLHRPLPDATVTPSVESLRQREEWKESIRGRYVTFMEKYGDVLSLDYPFLSDPGWYS